MQSIITEYPLEIIETQIIQMPKDAEIISVVNRFDRIYLCTIEGLEEELESRKIELLLSNVGINTDTMNERIFIGSVPIGGIVWHVFERFQ